MPQPGLNLPALSYRIVFTIFGSYLAARHAPRNPMRHALLLGFIGLFFGTAVPCAWIGGALYRPSQASN